MDHMRIRNQNGRIKQSSLYRSTVNSVSISDLCETGEREITDKGEELITMKHMTMDLLFTLKKIDIDIESRLDQYKDLCHPKIIYMYSSVSDNNGSSLVLEDASEGNLYLEILLNGCIPSHSAKKVLRDVCEAIKYLHDKDIIHRSIRSNHIHFNDSGQTKLDFWLYDLEIEESDAPELKKGEEPSKESDLWAIGVLLYEVLHGFTPSENFVIRKDICPNANDLIRRILVKNPQKRITLDEIMNHPFFLDDPVDMNRVINKLERYLNSNTSRGKRTKYHATPSRSTCESKTDF